MRSYLLPGISLLLFACGLLLLFEVVRPFRNPDIGVPMTVACWILGIVLSAAGMWLRVGKYYLNLVALVLNALVLVAGSLLAWLIMRSWKLF